MLPEEVRSFDDRYLMIFKEGKRPVKAKKIRYYNDRFFKKRVLPPLPVPINNIARVSGAIIDEKAREFYKEGGRIYAAHTPNAIIEKHKQENPNIIMDVAPPSYQMSLELDAFDGLKLGNGQTTYYLEDEFNCKHNHVIILYEDGESVDPANRKYIKLIHEDDPIALYGSLWKWVEVDGFAEWEEQHSENIEPLKSNDPHYPFGDDNRHLAVGYAHELPATLIEHHGKKSLSIDHYHALDSIEMESDYITLDVLWFCLEVLNWLPYQFSDGALPDDNKLELFKEWFTEDGETKQTQLKRYLGI